jgi:predicted MFS family arabinose efflux permease
MTVAQAGLARRGAGAEGLVIAFGAAVVVTVEFVVIGLSPLMAQSLGMPLEASGRFVIWFAIGSAAMGPLVALATRGLRADHALMLALLPFVAGLAVPWLGNAGLLCALRFLQGATLPLYIGIAADALSRLWGHDDKAVARIYLGVTVGSVLGAPLGVFVAQRAGWAGAFVCLGLLALVAVVLIAMQPRLRLAASSHHSMKSQVTAVARPAVLAHLLLSAVHFAAMFCCYAYLGGLLRVRETDEGAIGWLLLAFGAGGIAGNQMAARMTRRSTRALSIGTAALIAVAALVATRLPAHRAALLLLLVLWGAAHAASFVVCQLRVTRAAPQAPRLASALNISAANIGIAVGPAVGGAALHAGALPALGWTGFGIGALSMLMAWALAHPDADAPGGVASAGSARGAIGR